MAEALIALGGNVGDVPDTLDRAVAMLCDGGDVRLRVRSADYRTPPWGVTEQPPFVNLCIAVETGLTPHALLARAQAVEQALGRDRAQEPRWGSEFRPGPARRSTPAPRFRPNATQW